MPEQPGARDQGLHPMTLARGADPATDARFTDMAHRILMGQAPNQVALAHGITTRQLRRIFRDPRFWQLYNKYKEELWADLDGLIKDEKSSVALREMAIKTRTLTLLGELVEEARANLAVTERVHGEKGFASATFLRAAAEMAKLALGQRDQGGPAGGPTGQVAVQVNVTVPGHAAATFRDAAREADVDLSDLMEGIIDVTEAADAASFADSGTNGILVEAEPPPAGAHIIKDTPEEGLENGTTQVAP